MEEHEWGRAVMYRTTKRDIDDGVMFLTDKSRLGLGAPGCLNCGAPYESAPRNCTAEGIDPEYEPLTKPSSRRKDVRSTV